MFKRHDLKTEAHGTYLGAEVLISIMPKGSGHLHEGTVVM